MKKIIKLPSLSRVTPGSKATLELPLGATYERIIFTVSAAAGLNAPDIGRIGVLFNGQEKMTFKNLQRVIDLNTYYGRDADTVAATQIQFALHFNRAELADNIMRSAPGIGTNDLQTFHIEMEIDAAAPADIAITAHALVNPTRQNIGAFFNVKEFPISSATAGEVQADKLPRGAYYSAIHLFKADVTRVEVVANDIKIIDATKAILERLQKGASPKARLPVTATCTHIDFITDGNILESLPTAGLNDFRLNMTWGTAGACDIVTETIDTMTV
jgi:hypothetical protein